jgi:preprotein translocase subunit SecD
LNEAKDLVLVLKAGALPVPIRASNEQMIGPSLGRDGVEQGVKGALISFVIVLLFIAVYYEVGGVIADFMVILHLLFLLAAQAFFEASITLPGLVAMALNMGIAVDANVLINERIREELRNGKSPRVAVEQGFSRAFSSIFDSQITTLIAAVVLFQFGTGPIKGFAVTTIFGICTSLFTGVFCSRIAFDWLVRGLRVQRLRVG